VEKNIDELIWATNEVNGRHEIEEDKDVVNVMNDNHAFCCRQRARCVTRALKRMPENMKGWDLKDSAALRGFCTPQRARWNNACSMSFCFTNVARPICEEGIFLKSSSKGRPWESRVACFLPGSP
jgi:hypothetical protein